MVSEMKLGVGRVFLMLVLAGALGFGTTAQGRSRGKRVVPLTATGKAFEGDVKKIILEYLTGADTKKAREKIDHLFEAAVAYLPKSDLRVLRDIVFVRKLTEQMGKLEEGQVKGVLRIFKKHPRLAYALVYQIKKADRLKKVYEILIRLNEKLGKDLDKFANLAAAVCVVHDQRVTHRINENSTTAMDPLVVYAYYRKNYRSMKFDLLNMPVEHLIYVVDNAVSLNEMNWALANYKRHRAVGRLFFEIRYDYDHFKKGRKKRVTVEGWNLPNIKRYGGVCADQAYFSVAVGKSIGVPTCYTIGKGGSVAHAWVGYLRGRGRRGYWDFNSGRYAEYQGVKGHVTNPQTNRRIADSLVSINAQLLENDQLDRQRAGAYVYAAEFLSERAKSKKAWRVEFPEDLLGKEGLDSGRRGQVRLAKGEDIRGLVIAGLKASNANIAGWQLVGKMALAGQLSLKDKRFWAGMVNKFCGRYYPDFALEILEPMIKSVADVREQDKLWEGIFGSFRGRKDLAGRVRLLQGEMWEKHKDSRKAGICYLDVVKRFANDGPFAMTALKRAEASLVKINRGGDAVLELYKIAWRGCKKPKKSAFSDQSNYYKIGLGYANRLGAAGYGRDAQIVRAEIDTILYTRNKKR